MAEKTQRGPLGLFYVVIFLQVLDVVIHVAANQIEPLRLLASGVLAAALISTRFLTQRNFSLLGPAIGIYLACNLIFVLQNGLINNVSGEPRVALILLVVASCVSSYFYGQSLLSRGQK
jgi:hypothetical protein